MVRLRPARMHGNEAAIAADGVQHPSAPSGQIRRGDGPERLHGHLEVAASVGLKRGVTIPLRGPGRGGWLGLAAERNSMLAAIHKIGSRV